MEKEELINLILDKLTFTTGFSKGISCVLRSSGQLDPLSLSADFESLAKDILLIQDSFINLVEKLEEENLEEDEELEVEED